MIKKILKIYFYAEIKTALSLLLWLSFLTGFCYPVLVNFLAKIPIFYEKANGSLIEKEQQIIGSKLIGQLFDDVKYFWGRPSETALFPYNAVASQGSNLGPDSKLLMTKIKNRIAILHKSDPKNIQPIPIELVTASASGLDPHISPEAAFYQIGRISKVRRLSEKALKNLILEHIEKPQFGFLGEDRINVLNLNLALDNLTKQ